MNAAGIAGQIRRRGSVMQWHHAIPAHGNRVDPLTKQPILTAGGPRKVMGPTGESYHEPVPVRALWSKKVSDVFTKSVGIIDQSDAQLLVSCPFLPEPQFGIAITDTELLDAFNAGQFVQMGKSEDDKLLARDKFVINGAVWIVKSQAVPVVDANRTVAWRLLIAKFTY